MLLANSWSPRCWPRRRRLRSTACTTIPSRDAIELAGPAPGSCSRCRRRRCPTCTTPQRGRSGRGGDRRDGRAATPRRRAAAASRSRRSSCARSSGQRYDPRNRRPLRPRRPPPTATSPSPIRRYPDLVCHRALLALPGPGSGARSRPGGAGGAGRGDPSLARAARRARGAPRRRHLPRVPARTGAVPGGLVDAAFDGEVVGLIEGAPVRPVRGCVRGAAAGGRLGRERLELDRLGVAMVGETTGRRVRLGDPSPCACARSSGRVGAVLDPA